MKEIVKKIIQYWNKVYWNEFDKRAELKDLKITAMNKAFWTEFSRRTNDWFLRNEDVSGCAEKEAVEVLQGQKASFMPLYEFENSVRACYSMLQDDSSRRLFWARLKYEVEGKYADLENLMQLVSLIPGLGGETSAKVRNWAQTLLEVGTTGKKLVLYGGREHVEEIGGAVD